MKISSSANCEPDLGSYINISNTGIFESEEHQEQVSHHLNQKKTLNRKTQKTGQYFTGDLQ